MLGRLIIGQGQSVITKSRVISSRAIGHGVAGAVSVPRLLSTSAVRCCDKKVPTNWFNNKVVQNVTAKVSSMWLTIAPESPWAQLLAVSVGVQWLGWAVASYYQTEKFYDLVGSGTFLLVSFLSHGSSSFTIRQNVARYLVTAWALRLGSFLFYRVMKDGKDKRFDKAKQDPATFFTFWTMQGLWVFVTLIPFIALNTTTFNPAIGLRDYIGWSLWGLGFLTEVVADLQKSTFKSDPANDGKFIQSGLWSISRHPNYLGEISLWFGLFLTCSSVFRGPQYLTLVSPIMVTLLITKLSGIPLLEASGEKRWGKDAEYQSYVRDVPVLIPDVRKIFD